MDAIRLFDAVIGRWHYTGNRIIGVDYGQAQAAAAFLQLDDLPDVFERLQVLQEAVVALAGESHDDAD